jgi:4-hydroxybenzoate polyprenyltransferase
MGDEPNRTPFVLAQWVDLLRPNQWIKNVVVLAAPAAALRLFSGSYFFPVLVTFAAFCLAASGVYAINDVVDRAADSRHPTKRNRPVARGAIHPATAVLLGVALWFVSLTMTTLASTPGVTTVVGVYIALMIVYSLLLKSFILLDVIVISAGFVLRAWAGALAVGVISSSWLVACMFTLCLFLGFGKRRCELAMIVNSDDARHHRKTLVRYTPELLNHLITVSAGIAAMTFLLYTVETTSRPPPFPKEQLFLTFPLVIYGIFRFALVSELGLYSGPTEIVLKDRPLSIAIVVWALMALAIAYQVWPLPEIHRMQMSVH